MAYPQNDGYDYEALYERARSFCIGIARRGARAGAVPYAELMRHLGLDRENAYERQTVMPWTLRLVSEREHAAGRPFLSSVVYGETANEPGPGFDTLRRELGLRPGQGPLEFWIAALRETQDYWVQQPGTAS